MHQSADPSISAPLLYHGKNQIFKDSTVQQFKKFEDKTCGQEFSKIGSIRDGQVYVFDLKMKNESQIQNGDEVVLVPNQAGLITQCWYGECDFSLKSIFVLKLGLILFHTILFCNR